MTSRRLFVGLAAGTLLVAGCATPPSQTQLPPIVFVHGNGDSAALWQTTIWRFESNGWPRERLHAIDLPYPLARDDDGKSQAGRTSTTQHMEYLRAEVQKVLMQTGADKVVLIGNSRGGNAIRNYIQNGGGQTTVSHAILGGVPNHGIWAIPGFREGNEFSGTGPFIRALNAPKNAAGDEVTGPVRWLTIRSDNNDKYAQPDGLWIGAKGKPTHITAEGPALKGATNVVIARLDHRETSFSPASFEAAYRFITGQTPGTTSVRVQATPVFNGTVHGLGLNPSDPASGNFASNLPLAAATVDVFAIDPLTGERRGAAVHHKTTGADGLWGPFTGIAGTSYEFVVSHPGYATTHIYRSPLPRGTRYLHLRPERIAEADRGAPALVTFVRPRGYFDPARDQMLFDGQKALPGVPAGAGVAASRIKPAGAARTISGEFNGERVTGQTWPVSGNHVTVLELTY